MKVLTILLTVLPLMAQDPPSDAAWPPLALKAQQQMRQGRFAEAAESANAALQVAKRFGSADKRLPGNYHLLGAIYRDWGHCAPARANYAHAIALWRSQSDSNPRYLFASITNLVSTMIECDDFSGAEKAFRAYQPDLERCRSGPMDEAKLLSIRAILARGRKNYAQADVLYRQAIALEESAPQATRVDIAVERSSLAVILGREGRQAESLAESEYAIAFLEQHAPRHPSLVAALNNAACTLADMGRNEESERMFQRALQTAEDLFGDDNRFTAKVMLSYARVLRENKESVAAADLKKRGTDAFRRSLARDNGTIDAEELKALIK